jgi:hypothetical protein
MGFFFFAFILWIYGSIFNRRTENEPTIWGSRGYEPHH